jgi:hypothetical protein
MDEEHCSQSTRGFKKDNESDKNNSVTALNICSLSFLASDSLG